MASLSFEQAPGWVLDRLGPGAGRTIWVGIDGFGASGKSTLAARIAAVLPGSVVLPIDHFGRAALRDWDRGLFMAEVVEPLVSGVPGRYQHWDLAADVGLEWVDVPVGVPVIVEGVSSTDVRLPVPWDVTLWVDAAEDVHRERILQRDPPELLERWRTDWWPSEEEYAITQDPRGRVDAVVA